MRIGFPLFVHPLSLSRLLFEFDAVLSHETETTRLLFSFSSSRARRKKERERKTLENLIEFAVVGRVERGPFSANNSSPSHSLYSLYFKPSSRLPPETGTRVKSLFPFCSFSLSLLLESCCWKVLLGEMLSSLGKGREGKG